MRRWLRAEKRRRLSSARKSSRQGRVLSYEEIIEGPEECDRSYDDFVFEIPKDVEELDLV